MNQSVFLIDTSSLIEIAKSHPQDIYPRFWDTFNRNFDELLRRGEVILTNFVFDEILHNVRKWQDNTDDPLAVWMKERKKYILHLGDSLSIYSTAMDILSHFPRSADIEKVPPAADPYLIAYVLERQSQKSLSEPEPHYIIVTEEHGKWQHSIEKLQKIKIPTESITKIPDVCKYYGIDTLNYFGFFRAMKWEF